MTDRRVRAIMTPRRELIWMDADAATRLAILRDNRHALTLVTRGKLDALLGVVRKQDLLDAHLDGQPMDPLALLRGPVVVHNGATVLHVLELFKNQPVQMAVVVDEYGIVQGIVTQTDLLEAMAGEIPGEDEAAAVIERDNRSLLIDGVAPFADVTASACQRPEPIPAIEGMRARPRGRAVNSSCYATPHAKSRPRAQTHEVCRAWRHDVACSTRQVR